MSVKCLIYCCKTKPNLYKTNFVKIEDIKKGIWDKLVYEIDNNERLYLNGEKKETLNGKIVASFDCEKVEEVIATKWSVGCCCNYYKFETKDLLKKSCLGWIDLTDYLQDQNGYAIHISNVKVFDKPLSFQTDYIYKDYKTNAVLTKAPQNMCNVYDSKGNHYVLISIKPEWVAKILNGEKTIEVKKQIVNKLKELI